MNWDLSKLYKNGFEDEAFKSDLAGIDGRLEEMLRRAEKLAGPADVETFLKEAIAKYIIGDYSYDSYDTDFVGKLEGMNIERCVELYQQAYDHYMENHAA